MAANPRFSEESMLTDRTSDSETSSPTSLHSEPTSLTQNTTTIGNTTTHLIPRVGSFQRLSADEAAELRAVPDSPPPSFDEAVGMTSSAKGSHTSLVALAASRIRTQQRERRRSSLESNWSQRSIVLSVLNSRMESSISDEGNEYVLQDDTRPANGSQRSSSNQHQQQNQRLRRPSGSSSVSRRGSGAHPPISAPNFEGGLHRNSNSVSSISSLVSSSTTSSFSIAGNRISTDLSAQNQSQNILPLYSASSASASASTPTSTSTPLSRSTSSTNLLLPRIHSHMTLSHSNTRPDSSSSSSSRSGIPTPTIQDSGANLEQLDALVSQLGTTNRSEAAEPFVVGTNHTSRSQGSETNHHHPHSHHNNLHNQGGHPSIESNRPRGIARSESATGLSLTPRQLQDISTYYSYLKQQHQQIQEQRLIQQSFQNDHRDSMHESAISEPQTPNNDISQQRSPIYFSSRPLQQQSSRSGVAGSGDTVNSNHSETSRLNRSAFGIRNGQNGQNGQHNQHSQHGENLMQHQNIGSNSNNNATTTNQNHYHSHSRNHSRTSSRHQSRNNSQNRHNNEHIQPNNNTHHNPNHNHHHHTSSESSTTLVEPSQIETRRRRTVSDPVHRPNEQEELPNQSRPQRSIHASIFSDLLPNFDSDSDSDTPATGSLFGHDSDNESDDNNNEEGDSTNTNANNTSSSTSRGYKSWFFFPGTNAERIEKLRKQPNLKYLGRKIFSARFHFLLGLSRVLSILPALFGGWSCLLGAYHTRDIVASSLESSLTSPSLPSLSSNSASFSSSSSIPLSSSSSSSYSPLSSGTLEFSSHDAFAGIRFSQLILASLWCIVSGYLAYSVLDGLMDRWLVTYSTPAVIVRLVSSSALNIAMTHILVSVLSPGLDHRLHVWILISCILTVAYAVQNFVTSNLSLEKRPRSVDLYNIAVFAVVPVGLASFFTMLGMMRSIMILQYQYEGSV